MDARPQLEETEQSISRPPLLVIAGLLLAVMFDTTLQIVWKTAVISIPEEVSWDKLVPFITANPLFLGVIVIMAAQFFNWLVVLASTDLSFAQPVTSLSYVMVLAISAQLLGEKADWLQIVGVFLILMARFTSAARRTKQIAGKQRHDGDCHRRPAHRALRDHGRARASLAQKVGEQTQELVPLDFGWCPDPCRRGHILHARPSLSAGGRGIRDQQP
jgi:multidrug transporter EmrE-like cation transporter